MLPPCKQDNRVVTLRHLSSATEAMEILTVNMILLRYRKSCTSECRAAEILRQTRARDTNPYLTNATIKIYVSTSINTADTGCNSAVRMIYGGVYTSLGTARSN